MVLLRKTAQPIRVNLFAIATTALFQPRFSRIRLIPLLKELPEGRFNKDEQDVGQKYVGVALSLSSRSSL